jgi:C-terminal processing protease CtpA/Prc
MDERHDSLSLSRWMAARRLTLGVILLAGSMATSAAAVQQIAQKEARARSCVTNIEVYSGIGVHIVSRGERVEVVDLVPGGPSVGQLRPGAILVAADGAHPEDVLGWKHALTGEPGTKVTVEVAYPGLGHETVTIERAVIRTRAR